MKKYKRNRILRRFAAALCLAAMIAGMFGGLTRKAAAEKAPASELTGLTAADVVAKMGIGWNLGNTLDATGGGGVDVYAHEKAWGNPLVTQELISTVHAAGFNTIRIPITWEKEINVIDNYKIREVFLARVKEIVDYAYNEGMFVIINVHHESWVNVSTLDKTYRKVGKELAAVWAQIADYFADYDQHLIFEGMNEPRMSGTTVEWTGTSDAYEAVNYLSQVFAETVRGNGKGHNAERCLMIPGYAASCSGNVMSAVSLPTYNGEVAGNLIASVHCYSPYDFCLSDKQKTFSEDKDAGEIKAVFDNIKSVFLDNGIPVVLGETSATEKNNTDERVKWARCMGTMSQAYGIPIVIWDNGSDSKSGGESHAYINRKTNEWNYPTVVKALFEGFGSTERGSALKKSDDGGQSAAKVDGTPIWSVAEGATSLKEWDSTYIRLGSKSTWYEEGRKIAIVYKPGAAGGEPKLILDSERKQKWWIPVEPSERTSLGDFKVVWYDYDTIMKELKANDITDPADLRNFMIITTSAGVTTYEITVTGEAKVTYYVNGKLYASGDYPQDPVLADWVFEGWYLSKDYKGEFTKETKLEGDAVVYAKLRLKTEDELPPEPTPTPTPLPPTPTETPVPTEPVPTEPAPTEIAPTESVPTQEPVITPTGAQEPIPTVAPKEAEEPEKDDKTFIWAVVMGLGLVGLAVICAVIMALTKKYGKKK